MCPDASQPVAQQATLQSNGAAVHPQGMFASSNTQQPQQQHAGFVQQPYNYQQNMQSQQPPQQAWGGGGAYGQPVVGVPAAQHSGGLYGDQQNNDGYSTEANEPSFGANIY